MRAKRKLAGVILVVLGVLFGSQVGVGLVAGFLVISGVVACLG